jgi:hypothetical protein
MKKKPFTSLRALLIGELIRLSFHIAPAKPIEVFDWLGPQADLYGGLALHIFINKGREQSAKPLPKVWSTFCVHTNLNMGS